MIADGWHDQADERWIHYQTGRDHLNVSRINPY